MTPEQIERKRKGDRESAARYYAKVKDTPEYKAKSKLVRENYTEERRVQIRKISQEQRQTTKRRIARAEYSNSDNGRLSNCKGKLAARLGVAAKDLPDELVEAKFAQLKVKRLIRDLG